MKPVKQEITTGNRGDCLSACLASLLELKIGDVPKFRRDYGPYAMMPAARAWLRQNFGLSLIRIDLRRVDFENLGVAPGQLCIAGGRSPAPGGLYHAVIGRIAGDGGCFETVHDPHPAGRGLRGKPVALYFLVPIDIGPRSRKPKRSRENPFECPRSF
jgi:hypothetical protein